MNSSPPGSSVHGIIPARTLEWVAISFSRGSSQPRDQTHVSCLAGEFFTTEPSGKLSVSFLTKTLILLYQGPTFTALCICVHTQLSSTRSDPMEPTRLLCPWDYPSKNTGVGCHFPLQGLSSSMTSTLITILPPGKWQQPHFWQPHDRIFPLLPATTPHAPLPGVQGL